MTGKRPKAKAEELRKADLTEETNRSPLLLAWLPSLLVCRFPHPAEYTPIPLS